MRDCRPDHGGGETGAGRFALLTPNPSSRCAMHNPHGAAAVEQDQCNAAPHESSHCCMKPFFKDKIWRVRALVAGALVVSAYGAAVARELLTAYTHPDPAKSTQRKKRELSNTRLSGGGMNGRQDASSGSLSRQLKPRKRSVARVRIGFLHDSVGAQRSTTIRPSRLTNERHGFMSSTVKWVSPSPE
jgi:hypothetical protein